MSDSKPKEDSETSAPAIQSWWTSVTAVANAAVQQASSALAALDDPIDTIPDQQGSMTIDPTTGLAYSDTSAPIRSLADIVDSCKRDLKEFVSTVSAESRVVEAKARDAAKQVLTTNVVHQVVVQAKEVVQQAKHVSGEVTNMAKDILLDPSDGEPDAVDELVSSLATGWHSLVQTAKNQLKVDKSAKEVTTAPIVYDRRTLALQALHQNLDTFLVDPMTLSKYKSSYSAFIAAGASQRIASSTEEIAHLLQNHESLRTAHSKLVPETVSYNDFWMRYFYHVSEWDALEAKRLALIQGATSTANEAEDEFKWDSDDEKKEVNNALDTGKTNEKETAKVPIISPNPITSLQSPISPLAPSPKSTNVKPLLDDPPKSRPSAESFELVARPDSNISSQVAVNADPDLDELEAVLAGGPATLTTSTPAANADLDDDWGDWS